MVVPGCLVGKQCIFCICCICSVGREGIVFYSVGGPPSFFVFLFILVWARHGYRATNWKAVLPLLDRLWRAIAPLMKPWCAEGEVPSAANLNLYRGRSSYVGWHSDDEPLFGERGEAKPIVSVSFGPRRSSNGRVSPVQAMMVVHAGLAMVTSWSWMVNARMSSVIVWIPVRIRKGLTSRSVGSNSMLPLVPC